MIEGLGRVKLRVDSAVPGAEVIWVDTGVMIAGFLPAAGGRMVSLQVNGREALWRNSALLDSSFHPRDNHELKPHAGSLADWCNYGGDKSWLAPQGWSGPDEWAGPPDPVLDSGVYQWSWEELRESGLRLTLLSGEDQRSGTQLQREFTFAPGAAAYDLSVTATNISNRPVTWSIWNVTQRSADEVDVGGVWLSNTPDGGVPVELAVGTVVPDYAVGDRGISSVPHQNAVGKLGFPQAGGWLAHGAQGLTTTQSMSVYPGAEYPDEGSRVEVWMESPLSRPLEHLGGLQPKQRIVETEMLSPRWALLPGEGVSLGVRGGITQGVSPVTEVTAAGHWVHGDDQQDGAAFFGAYVSGTLRDAQTGDTLAQVSAGELAAVPFAPDIKARWEVVAQDGTRFPATVKGS